MSVDSRFAQGAFAERLGLSYPLVSDWPRFRSSRAFGAYDEERGWTRRVTFVIDKQGTVRHVVDDPDDMRRHAREALEAVRALAGRENGVNDAARDAGSDQASGDPQQR